jgi:hypothetical protein
MEFATWRAGPRGDPLAFEAAVTRGGMFMKQVLHQALDGSHVRVVATEADLTNDASSISTFYVDGRAQEFTASNRGFGEAVALEVGLRFEEEYAFQGGRLRLASGVQSFPTGDPDGTVNVVSLHIGTWEGEKYSVHTHLYGESADGLLGIFNQFLILESALGIRLTQKDPERTPLYSDPKVMKDVPQLGLLQVKPLSTEAARYLPRWEGTRVAGGELFAEADMAAAGDECGKTTFYLVGKDSVSYIAPREGASRQELARQLATLRVAWRRAA